VRASGTGQRATRGERLLELRRIAAGRMRLERANHTLQPTALVHEAYLRLADGPNPAFQDRTRFLSLAARVMRNILIDHARKHRSGKRGGGAIQVTLEDDLAREQGPSVDVLAVDEALTRLAELDPRQAEILEFHFFAGLTFEEISAHLGISLRLVMSDWAMARAWLHQELSPEK
jgi:RNA polymerase sigma-70 factor (ECF subfamily)